MTTNDFARLLAGFPETPVLILGDLMLDEYIWGEVRRISPEAPVPVVEIESRTYRPGGAGNAAAAVTALGGRAFLAGVVGDDDEARRLRRALSDFGIDGTGCIVDVERPTTTKTRIVANSQHVIRADAEQRKALPRKIEEALIDWAEERLADVEAFILSDYSKGVVSPALAHRVIDLVARSGKPIIVDPKGRDYRKYRGATVVTPNIHEAEWAANVDLQDAGQLPAVAKKLQAALDGSAVLITRGPDGMSLFSGDDIAVDIPAAARNVFDVTGAGDVVVGTLAMALAQGSSLPEAAQVASAAAGIVVGKVGTATASLEELHLECSVLNQTQRERAEA